MHERGTNRRKRASRWKFPNLRYGLEVGDILRLLLADVKGFHQGALLQGAKPTTPREREAVRKRRTRLLEELAKATSGRTKGDKR